MAVNIREMVEGPRHEPPVLEDRHVIETTIRPIIELATNRSRRGRAFELLTMKGGESHSALKDQYGTTTAVVERNFIQDVLLKLMKVYGLEEEKYFEYHMERESYGTRWISEDRYYESPPDQAVQFVRNRKYYPKTGETFEVVWLVRNNS